VPSCVITSRWWKQVVNAILGASLMMVGGALAFRYRLSDRARCSFSCRFYFQCDKRLQQPAWQSTLVHSARRRADQIVIIGCAARIGCRD